MKENIVISLGGSIINPSDIDISFLSNFKKFILENINNYRFIIVCGGGNTARKYVKALEKLNIASDETKDLIGITATKINAQLVKDIFQEKSYEEIVSNPLSEIKTNKDIIIASGWKPGFSSDMDAVLLAKNIGSDKVLNISNIDYVYDKDPKIGDAKKFSKLSWDDYLNIIDNKWSPGLNTPFDPIASKEAKDSGKKVYILSSDLKNLQNCIEGNNYKGTLIE
ncbi:MAG: UMP kinase [Nanobdellota archaeon]